MGSRRRANQVVSVAHCRDPVAQRLVQRVLQALAAGIDRGDFRAQQFHAKDVERLAFDIDAAHEDFALAFEQRRHGRSGDAMLAGPGLGRDARLAHALGEQRLAERIVDLVRAGMAEVFALQINLRAAQFGREIGAEKERRRPSDVFARVARQVFAELRIPSCQLVGFFQFEQRGHQGFGDEAPAKLPETSATIREILHSR